ncbi:MAG: DUF1587 domain-containing protein, partial [Planctomycetaceae bacterium]
MPVPLQFLHDHQRSRAEIPASQRRRCRADCPRVSGERRDQDVHHRRQHVAEQELGIDLRPADAFPSDEVGAGFDNNGDVLSLSPMLVEKYLDAAETVAASA